MEDNDKLARLRADLKKDPVAGIERDVHQDILDLAYALWQADDKLGYDGMLDKTQELYGDVARAAVQLGKYNQQVCNGGHMQYWSNGYASTGSRGCFSVHDNQELHDIMTRLFKSTGLCNTQSGQKVLDILEEFEVYTDDERYVENEYTDEETGERYTSNDENETYGEITNARDLNKLDARFYEVNDEWMRELGKALETYVDTGELPKAPEILGGDVNVTKPKVKLVGTDGNAFCLMGKVVAALRKAGQADRAKEFQAKATSGDYDNLLATCCEYAEVS